MMETSQLFAHCVAKIEPHWLLDIAKHMTKESYFEPHYTTKTGQVLAFAKVSLLGLVLTEKKRVNYSDIDPSLSREIFIRSALVEGLIEKHYTKALSRKSELRKNSSFRKDESKENNTQLKNSIAPFYFHNQELIDSLKELENKTRRRDLLVDDNQIYDLYNAILPETITNLAGFEHWRKMVEKETPRILFLSRESLTLNNSTSTEQQFPNSVKYDEFLFPVSYQFNPGRSDDGVSISVPVNILHLSLIHI